MLPLVIDNANQYRATPCYPAVLLANVLGNSKKSIALFLANNQFVPNKIKYFSYHILIALNARALPHPTPLISLPNLLIHFRFTARRS